MDSQFQKKTYSKLDRSPLGTALHKSVHKKSETEKRIIPSSPKGGRREDFKSSFLPLLIDVFELRQMIENHKQMENGSPIPLGKLSKTPQQVLEQLESMQDEVEEARRWFDGVILQISKGISEAQEVLGMNKKENEEEKESTSLLKRILQWLQ
ncbi:MAG: hypothetical protein SNF33_05790 [Candidatus Algichlamydia australiensis]|nr:hypothetical protein [Chlamydiales bacterium]